MLDKQIKNILIDTNVVLDFIDDNREYHLEAVDILLNLDCKQTKLLVTTQTVNNVYKYQINKMNNLNLSTSQKTISIFVADFLNDLLNLFTVVGVDHFDIKLAAKLVKTHLNFEDNLLIAAAERSGSDFILTSSVQILNDFPQHAIDYKNLEKLLNF